MMDKNGSRWFASIPREDANPHEAVAARLNWRILGPKNSRLRARSFVASVTHQLGQELFQVDEIDRLHQVAVTTGFV
jgi:hypothetical protein